VPGEGRPRHPSPELPEALVRASCLSDASLLSAIYADAVGSGCPLDRVENVRIAAARLAAIEELTADLTACDETNAMD
jgi:hypothetical protein